MRKEAEALKLRLVSSLFPFAYCGMAIPARKPSFTLRTYLGVEVLIWVNGAEHAAHIEQSRCIHLVAGTA